MAPRSNAVADAAGAPGTRRGSWATRFEGSRPEVEIVLKSTDEAALAEAVGWLEPQLAAVTA